MPDLEQQPAAEPLLRLLFEQAPGFIAVLQGPRHVITLCNPAYQTLVGTSREVLGRAVTDALPEAVEQGFVALLDGVLATGKPHIGRRTPYMPPRGAGGEPEQRFVDFVYQPLFDQDGRATGIFLQGHDVTDHVHAEELLKLEAQRREAQARTFDVALSSIQDFAYTFDRAHRFTYSNRALLDLLGMRLHELVGKTFLELPYERELAQRLCDQIEQVFVTRAQVVGETYYKSPTGADGYFEYIFNPVLSPDGEVVTVAGSTRDITHRRNQEKRLAELIESERVARSDAERASRMKDEFLATLSHELRTPLNAILGWSEVLRNTRIPQDKVQEGLERISRNARVQAQLISDLLDVNAIVNGKVHLNLERIRLGTPLQAALDAVRWDAAKKGVALVLSDVDGDHELDADAVRLQQVFWNLLTNAIKFTDAGGSVTVSVAVSPDAATVSFADSGMGVKPDFLPHLFERFSQADSTSTRAQGGLGLGLSICKSLVALHGGQILADSAGVGKGATFTVTLPLVHVSAASTRSLTLEASSGGAFPTVEEVAVLQGARVLVVDDDPDGAGVLVTLLRHYGAATVFAQSAEEALALLAAGPVELMVCDIGMPRVNGYELLRRAREFTQAPAIALTAFVRPQDRQLAAESGFRAHASKPIEPGAIVALCADALRDAKRDRQ